MYTSLHVFCWVKVSLVLNIWKCENASNIQKLLKAKRTKYGLNMIPRFNSCTNCAIVNSSLLHLKVHLLESVSELLSAKDMMFKGVCEEKHVYRLLLVLMYILFLVVPIATMSKRLQSVQHNKLPVQTICISSYAVGSVDN